jgi:Tfp pilus assembly protein PilO
MAIGATVGLLALWFMFLWGPQGGRLHDAHERTTAAQQENQGLELRLARLRSAQEHALDLTADVEQLRRAVPETPELAEFILDSNQAASDADVDFLSVSPGEPTAGVGALPPVIPLNIDVNGSYFSVLDYLDKLSSLPRVVVIDSISLTPDGAAAQSGDTLSVALTGRMFTQTAPQLQTTTSAAPAVAPATTVPAAAEQVTTSTLAPPDITVSGAKP